jgi:hypothetical protein
MTESAFETIRYQTQDRQVSWQGISMAEGDGFKSFMTTRVTSRLQDEEEANEFRAHLRDLASTGFAVDSLDKALAAEIPEERDWAIGEAMAEAYLERRHGITWPWNMKRDMRTPKASLPGADLVGFEIKGDSIRLTLGEVKTSGDADIPPGVMNGRSGMRHQIDELARNLSLIIQLLKWLWPRCKEAANQASFDAAVGRFFGSKNKDVALFGVLIRDTQPNELDLQARGRNLADDLEAPATCQLIALYLPCAIVDLPQRVSGGELS